MNLMRPVIKIMRILGSVCVAAYVLAAILVFYSAAARVQTNTIPQQPPVLDFTAQVPTAEQGFPGIPGASFGGSNGVRDNSRYQLPLEIQMLRVSDNNKSHFNIEITLRNAGSVDFDLPSSRNLTSVEQPGNKSQRILFFRIEALAGAQSQPFDIGGVGAGGSTSVPNSFTRLAPGESIRILLPASQRILRGAFKGSLKQLEVRVVCHEWQLEDSRYFLQASSGDAISKNAIKFVLRDGRPTPLR